MLSRFLHLQKEEQTHERGKFARRKIESNWSRYDDPIEGEVSHFPSTGEAEADEDLSAVAAREGEARAHQEDLRFKQLVESASEECTLSTVQLFSLIETVMVKCGVLICVCVSCLPSSTEHRVPLTEVPSETSNSFSSDLFQINVSSLAESVQNIPLNERLLMDKDLFVAAGLMEDGSQDDQNLKRMTVSQLRQYKSEDVQSSRTTRRLQLSPASCRGLPVTTVLPSDACAKQDKVSASAGAQPVAARHTSSAAEQALANARPQAGWEESQPAFKETRADSSRTAAASDDSGSAHMPGSSAPLCADQLHLMGGAALATPIERSLEPSLTVIGPPRSQHKMVELARTLALLPAQRQVEDEDSQLEAMLDELLTL